MRVLNNSRDNAVTAMRSSFRGAKPPVFNKELLSKMLTNRF